MLTIQQANEQLQTAYQKNPGPWVEHSRSVAENARRIAEHTNCLDPNTAYTMGCNLYTLLPNVLENSSVDLI